VADTPHDRGPREIRAEEVRPGYWIDAYGYNGNVTRVQPLESDPERIELFFSGETEPLQLRLASMVKWVNPPDRYER
jgi:hypothetical protein